MDILEQRWLIDRADRLRATCGSSSGLLLTANAITISALGFLTNSLWEAIKQSTQTPWHFWAQMAVFGLAWIALGASFIRAIAAVTAANGFSLNDYPGQPLYKPLLTVSVDQQGADPEIAPLDRQLQTAAYHLSQSQSNLRKAAFNLLCVPLLVFVSYIVQGLLQK